MAAIDEIKARIDIVDLVSETVQLRRAGKNYTGFCPFHANTRTPAFVVFPETGTWRCFGQCNEGGDIFKFIMKREAWDFPTALKQLAERAGIELAPPTPQETAAAEEHDRLRMLLEEVVTFYRHHLRSTPAGNNALEYLYHRGLKNETIDAFGLGYAPPGWDTALNYFTEKGYSERDLMDAGLITERSGDSAQERSSRVYDRFRHRIVFPIRDERGRMAGFGGRVLNPDDVPKFLNSPQTVVFDKGHLLYGLDRARRSIRSEDQVVIVEGYLDVIALHQAGFSNAVSPMGTALTEHQLYLIKRFTRRIVLALDPDAAGAKATLRGLEIARQTMDRQSDPVFDARGLLSHEARLQADIRVTTLPPGMDPDDVVNRDPDEWRRILEKAQPVVMHVMQSLAEGQNLSDPKVKSDLARKVLPLIEDVPDSIERETYRQQLARMLRVDERALIGTGARIPRGRSGTRGRSRRTAAAELLEESATRSSASLLESHCLGILVRHPDLVFRVDRIFQEYGLPRLSVIDFHRSEFQAVFELVLESLHQDVSEPNNFVLNYLPLELMDQVDELLKVTENVDVIEDRLLEDLVRSLVELRKRNLQQHNDYLQFLMQETQEQGNGKAGEYNQLMKQNIQVLYQLNRAHEKYTNRIEQSR
jgi:DNA primase